MEIQRIRTWMFFLQKLCELLSILFTAYLIYMFIGTKDGTKPYLLRFDIPIWFYMVGYITIILSIIVFGVCLLIQWSMVIISGARVGL